MQKRLTLSPNKITSKHILFFIILFAVLVRVLLVFFSYDLIQNKYLLVDTWKYDRLAQNLAFRGIYTMDNPESKNPTLSAFYPPVYPLLISLIYRTFGYIPKLVNYSHVFLFIIACIALFKLGVHLFGEVAASLGILFFAFEPVSLFYSIVALPEILVAIFLPISLLYFLKFLKQNPNRDIKYRYLIVSIIVLVIAVLTKPIVFYFPVVLFLIAFIYWYGSWKRLLVTYLIILCVAVLGILPWAARNTIILGKPAITKAEGFIPLRKKEVIHRIKYARNLRQEIPGAMKTIALRYFFGTSTIRFYLAFDRTGGLYRFYEKLKGNDEDSGKNPNIKRHFKGSYVRDYIKLMEHSWRFASLEILFLTLTILVYILAFIGGVFAVRNGKLKELFLILVIFFYFAAIILLIESANSKYRFYSIPFYSILAGYGLSCMLKREN